MKRAPTKSSKKRDQHLETHCTLKMTFVLENPGSTMYTTPSMVIAVSAMLVAIINFRPIAPFGLVGGAGSNILPCSPIGNVEYKGQHFMSPTAGPILSHSSFIRLHVSSISS